MYLPKQYKDDFSLALRLLRTRNRSAYEAMAYALLGALLMPVDKLWARKERERYARYSRPQKPLLIFVGPPRGGTTLLAQAAIAASEGAYFNNLTAIFPRSPIEANARIGRRLKLPTVNYTFYYGKTTSMNGFNDGLHIWDRWLGDDRRAVPQKLEANGAVDMKRFFAAFEDLYAKPAICKINRLDCCAHLVAEALPRAKFVCLQRAPVPLATSLYRARVDITGSLAIPYGTNFRRYAQGSPRDPIKDIASQVRFHHQAACRQRELVGPDRFKFVRYEDFCRNPRETMKSILTWGLGARPARLKLANLPDRFRISQVCQTQSSIARSLTRELTDASEAYASVGALPGGIDH